MTLPTDIVAIFYSNSINSGASNQPILDQSIIAPDVITEEEQGNQQNFDRIPRYSVFSLNWNIFVELLKIPLNFPTTFYIAVNEILYISESPAPDPFFFA